MYFVALEGTILNWVDIISRSLSLRIVVAQGGMTQRKSEFYMASYLIDCIMCRHLIPNINCDWDYTKTPIYVGYQILWAHKYSRFYKLICEEFLMPMYELIFLKESNCMSESAMKVICEYRDDYFSKEGT